MSGKNTYDERKRLEAENALLREQQLNARLKQEKQSEECAEVFAKAVTAFLTGSGSIVVKAREIGGFRITFEGPAQ